MAEKLVLHSRSTSPCCHDVNVLVLSRANGFVTQNCNTCETPQPLNIWELPELKCEKCKATPRTFINILKKLFLQVRFVSNGVGACRLGPRLA